MRKLREAERLQAEGADLDAVCRQLEVSVQTFQRWRAQDKAMRPEEVARLKQLEWENTRLKRIVGEQALEIEMVWEVANGRSRPPLGRAHRRAPRPGLEPRRRSSGRPACLPS